MTFRGTVKNGVIVPDPGQSLPEGMRVNMSPIRGAAGQKRVRASASPARSPAPKKRNAKKRPTRKAQAEHPLLALAGIWKNRPEWEGKSSIEVAAELRRIAMGRHRG